MNSINDIEEFTKNINEEDFYQDLKTQRAVRATLEIIGEASKKLPGEFKKEHSDIPWRDITDLRNVLIHDYGNIILENIWNVIKKDLPELKKKILPLWEEEVGGKEGK